MGGASAAPPWNPQHLVAFVKGDDRNDVTQPSGDFSINHQVLQAFVPIQAEGPDVITGPTCAERKIAEQSQCIEVEKADKARRFPVYLTRPQQLDFEMPAITQRY